MQILKYYIIYAVQFIYLQITIYSIQNINTILRNTRIHIRYNCNLTITMYFKFVFAYYLVLNKLLTI